MMSNYLILIIIFKNTSMVVIYLNNRFFPSRVAECVEVSSGDSIETFRLSEPVEDISILIGG